MTILRNKFTALALIIIAFISTTYDSPSNEEQTADAEGEAIVNAEMETAAERSAVETVISEAVTEVSEVSETEPEDEEKEEEYAGIY